MAYGISPHEAGIRQAARETVHWPTLYLIRHAKRVPGGDELTQEGITGAEGLAAELASRIRAHIRDRQHNLDRLEHIYGECAAPNFSVHVITSPAGWARNTGGVIKHGLEGLLSYTPGAPAIRDNVDTRLMYIDITNFGALQQAGINPNDAWYNKDLRVMAVRPPSEKPVWPEDVVRGLVGLFNSLPNGASAVGITHEIVSEALLQAAFGAGRRQQGFGHDQIITMQRSPEVAGYEIHDGRASGRL